MFLPKCIRIHFLNAILCFIRIIGIIKKNNNCILIIPPATAGSIGDYAMIDVLIREINHHKENQKIYIEGTQEDGWKEKFGSISMIHIDSKLVEKVCLSRFSHHLGILLRTGVDITQSLSISERVVGNAVIAQAVSEAREKVIQGGALWRSLQETGVFPPLVIRMIFIGETTGTIDNTLARVTEFYDREIPATVKKLFAVLEPLIIVVLAAIVLVVALSIFIPLYGALGRVGGRR